MYKTISIRSDSYKVLIKRNKRTKYLRLKIYKTGELILMVPPKTSDKKIIRFLEENKGWLEKRYSKLAFNMDKFRYLGRELKLRISTYKKDIPFYLFDDELVLNNLDGISVNELFDNWLMKRAKEYIPERVKELAELHDFHFNKVSVKKLLSRWGSCSSKGNLSFNYRLMSYNKNVIDYVIVHELCHLVEMNHSSKFWKLVESFVPNYKTLKQDLSFN